MRISTDSFAKVSADKDKGILYIIAFLMECSSTEVVLGCSEQSFYISHFSRLINNLVEKLNVLWAKDFGLKKSVIYIFADILWKNLINTFASCFCEKELA